MLQASVDLAHLSRYTGGDEGLNAEVLKLFDQQTTDLVERLRQVLAARDAKSWREVTHTLKGAARGIGAFDLAEACAFAEPIDPGDDAHAGPAYEALRLSAREVQNFIRAYLRR